MSATISCKSGDIIVLGGLRRSANSKSTSALAGIPFLGDLFGARQSIKTTNDLVFFVRPVVTDARTEDQAPDVDKKINELEKENQAQVREMLGLPPPSKPGSKDGPPPAGAAVPPGSTTFPSAPSTSTRPNSRGGR
jgi:type II secretory pathway component GspD/PulD (secretin)